MRKIAMTVALAVAAPMPAQAKTLYVLQPQPAAGQHEEWDNGDHAVVDAGAETVVMIVQARDELPGNSSAFRVYVANNSSAPFNFGPENVAVELPDGTRIGMQTFDNLQQRVNRDIKRRKFFAGLGGALMYGSANGYATGNFDYSGQVSGRPVSGFGTFSYNDPALEQRQERQALAQTEASFRAIRTRQAEAMQALGGLIQTSTVQPGKIYGGIVAYNPPTTLRSPKPGQLATIVVATGGTVHRIAATIAPMGAQMPRSQARPIATPQAPALTTESRASTATISAPPPPRPPVKAPEPSNSLNSNSHVRCVTCR